MKQILLMFWNLIDPFSEDGMGFKVLGIIVVISIFAWGASKLPDAVFNWFTENSTIWSIGVFVVGCIAWGLSSSSNDSNTEEPRELNDDYLFFTIFMRLNNYGGVGGVWEEGRWQHRRGKS